MKNLTMIMCAATAALALASCRQTPVKPEFASIDKAETMREDSVTLELDYRFEFLSWYSDEDVAAKIQTAMIADFFGQEYLRENPMESSKAFDQAISDMYAKSAAGDYKWNGFMKMRSYKDVIGDRIVAYTVEHSEYMGGAHGMETVMYYNYDLRTGDRLTLDDVFTPDGKAALADKIRGRILSDHGKDNWEELNEANCYFAQDSVLPTENFLLSREHITFLYNPYEIACYAQGRTKVKLPLSELEGFKKEIFIK